jgi:hypothetical protein
MIGVTLIILITYDDLSPSEHLILCFFVVNYNCFPLFSKEEAEETRIRRMYAVMPYLVFGLLPFVAA